MPRPEPPDPPPAFHLPSLFAAVVAGAALWVLIIFGAVHLIMWLW